LGINLQFPFLSSGLIAGKLGTSCRYVYPALYLQCTCMYCRVTQTSYGGIQTKCLLYHYICIL